MLEQLCAWLRCYFDRDQPKYSRKFTVTDGEIDLSNTDIQAGQYFRIIGSVFNDGVYQHPASGLQDEVFNGVVWLMKVPPAVTDMADRLEEWQAAQANNSGSFSSFLSESFGGYTYTRALGVDGGNLTAWDALAGDLKQLQRMYGKARIV